MRVTSFTNAMDPATKQEKLVNFQHLIAVETARSQIKNAVLVTVFTGVIIPIAWLVGTIVANMAELNSSQSSGYYWILETLFIFGMGYGISRYNSVSCGRLMFGYSTVSAIHELVTIGFTSFGISARICALSYKIVALYYLWIGIQALQRYHLLMRQERSSAAAGAVDSDRDRLPAPDRFADRSALQPRSAPTEPLNPTPELVGLCGGDRAQAQWLLSKVKSKHPDRSVAWCNQQVIEQLTT